jgi:hypothetical protein
MGTPEYNYQPPPTLPGQRPYPSAGKFGQTAGWFPAYAGSAPPLQYTPSPTWRQQELGNYTPSYFVDAQGIPRPANYRVPVTGPGIAQWKLQEQGQLGPRQIPTTGELDVWGIRQPVGVFGGRATTPGMTHESVAAPAAGPGMGGGVLPGGFPPDFPFPAYGSGWGGFGGGGDWFPGWQPGGQGQAPEAGPLGRALNWWRF